MVTKNWVHIVSGNDVLPDGTKPLPEPVTYLGQVQWHSTEGSFTKDISDFNH